MKAQNKTNGGWLIFFLVSLSLGFSVFSPLLDLQAASLPPRETPTPTPTLPVGNQAGTPGPDSLWIPAAPAGQQLPQDYAYNNPAGCANRAPASIDEMLNNVEKILGPEAILNQRRNNYIWNGPQRILINAAKDPFVAEFQFDAYKYPTTYLADKVVTAFLVSGFTAWIRFYNGHAYVTAVPMLEGVLDSPWGDYVRQYWDSQDAVPLDTSIFKTIKKLPCHWAVDGGFVTNDHLKAVFDFNYNVPDYLSAGSKYLAGTCPGAYTLSRELLGNADITTACGPLTWHILKDANSFPYRIDSLHNADTPFVGANPRWNGFPWIAFDPQLSTVIQNRSPMPAYDFQKKGNLFPGDIIFSHIRVFSNPTNPDKQSFAHIFVVAGLQPDGTRLAISNMIQNIPARDCSIRQVSLYTPGDLKNGVINHEWNGGGYGKTGTYGFDILRWKWQTFRINALPIPYTVRLGDTLETIGFDWKVNPLDIAAANHLTPGAQLSPGQSLTLPPVKP